jgi:translocator assembly and maintenance protein 41
MSLLLNVLNKHLPTQQVRWAVAYGSAVFHQKGYSDAERNRSMIDLIIGVNDPVQFHKENMKNNPHHYATMMRLAGPNIATKIQTDYGAGLYYNTMVDMDGKSFKYGIIEMNKLITDLEKWETLYVSGRLHKPVLELVKDERITQAQSKNLLNALMVSLAILSNRNHGKMNVVEGQVDLQSLYEMITSISYMGDMRMKVGGENKNKVKNIVSANVKGFDDLYLPILESNSELFSWKADQGANYYYKLPSDWHEQLPEQLRLEMRNENDMEQALSRIVNRSSTSQSLKGILTAGLTKSVKYAWAKYQKGRKS